MVSCCRLLGVRSFVLEVKSRSGHHVPINLYQTNVILCSDKKGQGPKEELSSFRVLVLAKRRQILVSSFLRARFPHPAQPSLLREPDIQPSWPSGHPNSGWRAWQAGPGSSDCDPGRRPLLSGSRDGVGERFTTASRPRVALVRALESCCTQPPVCPLAQGWLNWRASRRRPELASPHSA